MWQAFFFITVLLVLVGFAFPVSFLFATATGILSIIFGIAKVGSGSITKEWDKLDKIQCPFCKSFIAEESLKCKYCGEWVKKKGGTP